LVLVFFVKGIVVGAIIAVPVGPVGVLCLRKAIFEGPIAGLTAGLGAATADAFFGAIAAFGLTFIAKWLFGYEGLLRALGGCYLLYAGARALFATPPEPAEEQRHAESLFRDFASIFALTVTNPITILVFLGMFDVLGLNGAHATLLYAAVLVAGVWAGSLAWWLGLSFGVGMFRGAIGARQLGWISHATGIILLLSGAGLLALAVVKQLVHLV
jgi:threonine/homoserine/homoserine lactone efflux protein